MNKKERPQNKNLKVFTSDQDREEAAKNGRKGGIASGKARRERRKMADIIKILMQMSMIPGEKADITKIDSVNNLKGQNMTAEEQMIAQQFMKALKGDLKALTFLRDTMGEAPVNQVEFAGNMELNNPYGELTSDQLKTLANEVAGAKPKKVKKDEHK